MAAVPCRPMTWALLCLLLCGVAVWAAPDPTASSLEADADLTGSMLDGDMEGDAEDGDSSNAEMMPHAGIYAKAFFDGMPESALLNGLPPTIAAGELQPIHIALANPPHASAAVTVAVVQAYIGRVGDPLFASTSPNATSRAVQNFTGVIYDREVNRADTVTLRYDFTPSRWLEPMDYHVIVRVYFRDDDNRSYVATAWNATVTITDALGWDGELYATYAVIAAVVAGLAWYGAKRLGIAPKAKSSRSVRSAPVALEAGTKGSSYDPEYVSQEHIRYREAVLGRKSSSSPKRK